MYEKFSSLEALPFLMYTTCRSGININHVAQEVRSSSDHCLHCLIEVPLQAAKKLLNLTVILINTSLLYNTGRLVLKKLFFCVGEYAEYMGLNNKG